MQKRPSKLAKAGRRLAEEPPIRLLSRLAVKLLPFSVRTKARWDVVNRPHYLLGVLQAADQAREAGVAEISVLEIGVARGAGLLELQACAGMVEQETGVAVRVYGFDSGAGLPKLCGDYRDHPELRWIEGDYPLDETLLRPKLAERTRLVIGDVKDTVPEFLAAGGYPPIGFVALDVDLFTSTRNALELLSSPQRNTLMRTVLYFDDTESFLYHRHAGELLAIDEFNAVNTDVKIDRWRGIKVRRPFPTERWLERMYVAYDLAAFNEITAEDREVDVIDFDHIYG